MALSGSGLQVPLTNLGIDWTFSPYTESYPLVFTADGSPSISAFGIHPPALADFELVLRFEPRPRYRPLSDVLCART